MLLLCCCVPAVCKGGMAVALCAVQSPQRHSSPQRLDGFADDGEVRAQ